MYKKVMAAVDGSETAHQALAEAKNIANTYAQHYASSMLCIAIQAPTKRLALKCWNRPGHRLTQ
ncbi:Universal stress protein family protein [Nitrosomonas sp. Nm51]|uniref:universal stress protein n=1 Tax=Nitrosomonas sp. Nm51 TaxID=133720 RepID=UPI0008AEE433|nr:universal stress protein [Nitrosomonas sp. Nm51]SER79742.1 Universal stress protein family protein [Nitrosomonas sp. Nm51]